MKILGIDPGSRRTGWGLLEKQGNRHIYLASGTFNLEQNTLAQRLGCLAKGLEQLLDKEQPFCCAIEQIFLAKNIRSALLLGHARGVVLAAMARENIPLYEYAPTQVKQGIVGTGRATKAQIQAMVGVLLNRKDAFAEDEADALGLALTHAACSNLAERIS